MSIGGAIAGGLALVSSAVVAPALTPSYWDTGSSHGYDVFSLENNMGQSLRLTCASGTGADGDSSVDNGVIVESKGHSYDQNLSFVINSEKLIVPTDTYTTNGDSWAWTNFVNALGKATEFQVFSGANEIATFKVNQKDLPKYLSSTYCPSKKDWTQS